MLLLYRAYILVGGDNSQRNMEVRAMEKNDAEKENKECGAAARGYRDS